MKRTAIAVGTAAALLSGAAPAQAGSYNLAVTSYYGPGVAYAKLYSGTNVYIDPGTNRWGVAKFYVGFHRQAKYRTAGVEHWTLCSWTTTSGLWFTMNANTALIRTEVCP